MHTNGRDQSEKKSQLLLAFLHKHNTDMNQLRLPSDINISKLLVFNGLISFACKYIIIIRKTILMNNLLKNASEDNTGILIFLIFSHKDYKLLAKTILLKAV